MIAKRTVFALTLAALVAGVQAVPAQEAGDAGTVGAGAGLVAPVETFGAPILPGRDDNHDEINRVHWSAVARAVSLGIETGKAGRATRAARLQFPLRLKPDVKGLRGVGITNYVDLVAGGIQDFACGARTYDGHNGIDFAIAPYSWRMMDGIDVEVVAAAAGTIIDKQDGQFDRQCSWGGVQPANYVVVRQTDGYYAYYWHLKKNTVIKKAVGSSVKVGEVLGFVGSSGRSTGPHLHFEMRTAAAFGGDTADPFAGTCGASQTLWRHQPEPVDTDVLRIATHSAAPNPNGAGPCDNPAPTFADQFAPGARVYAVAYLRDQRPDTPLTISVIRPDNRYHTTWTTPAIGSVQPLNYWYISTDLPVGGPTGRWRLQVVFDGKVWEHVFSVGTAVPAATRVVASVSPRTISATTASPAKIKVTLRNSGTKTAVGCNIAPDAPLAATWTVHATSGGVAAGQPDRAFDLQAGATKVMQLTIKPKAGYRASAAAVPVRVTCNNADGPAATTTNTVVLSF